MDDNELAQAIINKLRQRGKFNAGELCDDEVSERQVRQIVVALRRKGMLIVRDCDGCYRMALHAYEVFEYTTALRKQIRTLYGIVTAMEESAKRRFRLDLDVHVGVK